MNNQHTKLSHLELVRGIAALFVVVFHWFDSHGIRLFGGSHLAVDLFYMMSGFVMSFAYQERLNRGMAFRDYISNRFIRLWPMLIVALLLGMVWQALGYYAEFGRFNEPGLFRNFFLGLLFLPAAFAGPANAIAPLNGPLYSLHFEMVAYVFFALLGYRLRDRHIAVLICAALPLLLLWVAFRFGGFTGARELFESPLGYLMQVSRIAFAFPMGMLLFRHRGRFARFATPLTAYGSLILCLFLVALPREISDVPGAVLVLAVFAPLTIALGSFQNYVGRFDNIAKLFGNISFPLYVTHVPVMWTANGSIKRFVPMSEGNLVYVGLIVVPICLLVALLLTRFIENPARRSLKRLSFGAS